MASLSKTIIDVATGEKLVEPFTAEETAAHLQEQKNIADQEAAALAELETQKAKKSALLERLGITEEEAKLLLG